MRGPRGRFPHPAEAGGDPRDPAGDRCREGVPPVPTRSRTTAANAGSPSEPDELEADSQGVADMKAAHLRDRLVPLDTDPEGSEPSCHGVDVVHPNRGVRPVGRLEIRLDSRMDIPPGTESGAAPLRESGRLRDLGPSRCGSVEVPHVALGAPGHGELHVVDALEGWRFAVTVSRLMGLRFRASRGSARWRGTRYPARMRARGAAEERERSGQRGVSSSSTVGASCWHRGTGVIG